MRRIFLFLLSAGLVGGALFWWATRPQPLEAADVDALMALDADAERGAAVFWAGGCAACHIAPGADDADAPVLSGGQQFETAFGTFSAPNISPDPDHGIGAWGRVEFANAMMRGISPQGAHYYPAFPYTAYAKAELQEMVDLQAFIATLPPSDAVAPDHDLAFPFTIRRGIGLWKRRYLREDWVLDGALSPELERGRHLVEALAHCAECHTPRDAFGGLDRSAWMAGAADPSGSGRIPAIHPDDLDWSAEDIALYLDSGFTPDFDVAGGSMAAVVRAMSRLDAEDRAAIAAYLLALE